MKSKTIKGILVLVENNGYGMADTTFYNDRLNIDEALSEIQEIINECKPKSSVLPELDIAVNEYQSNLEKRLK